MDALYVTLSVGKKTVVLGRYIFTYLVVGAAFLVIVFASYRLSLAFYQKREF